MIIIFKYFIMGTWSAFWMLITPFLIPIFFNREIPLVVGRKFFAPFILWVSRVKLQVKGRENVPTDRPIIFVSNHCSHIDISCVFKSVPRNIFFVAKRELLWIPFLGFNLWITGHILIDRSNKRKSIASMKRAASKIRGGKCVFIYAEGTRSEDGKLGKFKKGAFHLAMDAGVEIVPIHIAGTFDIWPKGTWNITPGKAIVNIGKPIHSKKYTKQTVNQFAEDTRNAIIELSKN